MNGNSKAKGIIIAIVCAVLVLALVAGGYAVYRWLRYSDFAMDIREFLGESEPDHSERDDKDKGEDKEDKDNSALAEDENEPTVPAIENEEPAPPVEAVTPEDDPEEVMRKSFFYHLSKTGSAGPTGQAGIDVHYYGDYFYYVPSSGTSIERVSEPGAEAEIIYESEEEVADLCIIDDYIFFSNGGSIVALDLYTKVGIEVFWSEEGALGGCYYYDGWIYTVLRTADMPCGLTIRFDPTVAVLTQEFQILFEGELLAIDTTNDRIFYEIPIPDETWNYPCFIYDLASRTIRAVPSELTSIAAIFVYDGTAYSFGGHALYGNGTHTIDANGTVTRLDTEAAQLTILNGQMYYSKWDGGMYVCAMDGTNERQINIGVHPIPSIMNSAFHTVAVGDRYIAFLGDDGTGINYRDSGLYIYDVYTAEVYRLS